MVRLQSGHYRFLVALPPVRVLLFCAKHLFVAAKLHGCAYRKGFMATRPERRFHFAKGKDPQGNGASLRLVLGHLIHHGRSDSLSSRRLRLSQGSCFQSGVTQTTGGEAGNIRVTAGSIGIGILVFEAIHFPPSASSHLSPMLNFRPSVVGGCFQPLQCASS
jgi:hypothetical protein